MKYRFDVPKTLKKEPLEVIYALLDIVLLGESGSVVDDLFASRQPLIQVRIGQHCLKDE
jgi:hypothetical protein